MIYLIITEGYDDPLQVAAGPFSNYNDALDGYRKMLIESGADIEPEETSESLYLNDDAIAMVEIPEADC